VLTFGDLDCTGHNEYAAFTELEVRTNVPQRSMGPRLEHLVQINFLQKVSPVGLLSPLTK
jgi:hypothetical protein